MIVWEVRGKKAKSNVKWTKALKHQKSICTENQEIQVVIWQLVCYYLCNLEEIISAQKYRCWTNVFLFFFFTVKVYYFPKYSSLWGFKSSLVHKHMTAKRPSFIERHALLDSSFPCSHLTYKNMDIFMLFFSTHGQQINEWF